VPSLDEKRIAAIVVLSVCTASCMNPPSVDELVAQRIVATKFDPNADFGSFKTFATVDSIPVFTAPDAGTPAQVVDGALGTAVIDAIAAQLTSRGYQRVARSEKPDLGVNVEAVARFKTANATSYGSWWGTDTATPTYWGYESGVFVLPFSYQTVAWRSGTLVIELFDLRDAGSPVVTADAASPIGATGSVPIAVVWGALIHGVIGDVDAAALAMSPASEIAQCFVQSPYLSAR
jgi:hypothetical protein